MNKVENILMNTMLTHIDKVYDNLDELLVLCKKRKEYFEYLKAKNEAGLPVCYEQWQELDYMGAIINRKIAENEEYKENFFPYNYKDFVKGVA